MELQSQVDILRYSFEKVWVGVVSYLPNFVTAILLLLFGLLIAAAFSKVIEQLIRSIKLDKALRAAGLEELLEKANMKLNSGKFIGELVKWFTIIVFLIATFDILKLTDVNAFLTGTVLGYLPNVFAAVFILLASVLIADFLHKTITASAKAAGIKSANLIGLLTKWTIWIFGILIALVQLGIGVMLIQTLFTGVVASLSIAFGLAFGLGGKEAAKDTIEKMKKEISHE